MAAAVLNNANNGNIHPAANVRDTRPPSSAAPTAAGAAPGIRISASHNILNNSNSSVGGGASHGLSRSTSNTSALNAALVNRPSLIEYKQYRFLIMDAPTENNVHAYIDILKKKGVVAVVRACEPTYQVDALLRAGIKVMEAPFADGDPPSDAIVNDWLALVRNVFADNPSSGNKPFAKQTALTTTATGTAVANGSADKDTDSTKKTIAVHCVAGLGRAPVMVAIALIEAGMQPIDVIDFIRKRRRGAFNSKQLKYIQGYKPRGVAKKGDCCIM